MITQSSNKLFFLKKVGIPHQLGLYNLAALIILVVTLKGKT